MVVYSEEKYKYILGKLIKDEKLRTRRIEILYLSIVNGELIVLLIVQLAKTILFSVSITMLSCYHRKINV